MFVKGHTSATSAKSVGLCVSATERRRASTHCVVNYYMPILKYSIKTESEKTILLVLSNIKEAFIWAFVIE